MTTLAMVFLLFLLLMWKEVESPGLQTEVVARIYSEGIGTTLSISKNENIANDFAKSLQPYFPGVRSVDMYKVYEDYFDRVPLSLVEYSWFWKTFQQQ